MSKHCPKSESMKALEQSLIDHMEICRLKRKAKRMQAEVARLKAEVERLRKAGDAVSLCLEAFWKGKPYDISTNIECFDAWNAAKEGKPNP